MIEISPPVLFFFLGMAAAFVRSGLRVPQPITEVLSLYLLWAIGFRGGVELRAGAFGREEMLGLALAVFLAVVVPLWVFPLMRRRLSAADAAAVAACYGSISAVTFMTAVSWLEERGIDFGGHMVAAMVLMESPALVIAVVMLRRANHGGGGARRNWRTLAHEAVLNGPVFLMLGSLAIGLMTGERGYRAFKPLCTDLFNGVLVFFLLDLGLLAAERLRDLRRSGAFLVTFSLVAPLINAALALGLGAALGLQEGNLVLLAILAASASYIAVPAAARTVLPEANPGLFVPMALALTFPFNIAVGIPLYSWIARWLT
jgi:hypothetical protein